MELRKSFSFNYVSTSEIVHVGRTYSTVLSNFRSVRFSRQLNCFSDKTVISLVGSDNLAAETSFHRINGINGSTWSLYSRNLRVLDALDDVYGGVVIDSDKLPANPSEFAHILSFSISHWKKMGKKGIWLKLPSKQSELVPIAVNVLVVQESTVLLQFMAFGRYQQDFVLQSEEMYTGAVREVKEETGIDTEFIEVIAFRHAHNVAFEKSDLFFICLLRPLSAEIVVDDVEIEAAKWMPLVEFVEQPLIQ